MPRKLIYGLIVLLSMLGASLYGQSQTVRYDSSLVSQVRPSPEREKEVFDEVDLGFAKSGENVDFNPVARFFSWLLEKLFGNATEGGVRAFQWSFIGLLVAAGVVLLVWLFRSRGFGSVLKGDTRKSEFSFSDVDEDISSIDFEAKISSALKDNDYRLAIRWLYLKQLFLLNEKSRIAWQPHKTNIDYANELFGSPLRQPFRDLSQIYEYAWYGDYPVSSDAFAKAEVAFRQFERQIGV